MPRSRDVRAGIRVYSLGARLMRVLLGVLGVLLVLMGFFMFYGMGYIKGMTINDVDLSRVKDGTYTGSFKRGRWSYSVEVTVKEQKIINIASSGPTAKMMGDFDAKASQAIIARQSPKVDAVSGATITTKAFSKAVENALRSGVR